MEKRQKHPFKLSDVPTRHLFCLTKYKTMNWPLHKQKSLSDLRASNDDERENSGRLLYRWGTILLLRVLAPTVAQSDGKIEHRMFGAVILDIGYEITDALKLIAGFGSSCGHVGLNKALAYELAVTVQNVEEILGRVRLRHRKETIVHTELRGDGGLGVKPVNGRLRLDGIGAGRTALGFRQVVGMHAHDVAFGVLFNTISVAWVI